MCEIEGSARAGGAIEADGNPAQPVRRRRGQPARGHRDGAGRPVERRRGAVGAQHTRERAVPIGSDDDEVGTVARGGAVQRAPRRGVRGHLRFGVDSCALELALELELERELELELVFARERLTRLVARRRLVGGAGRRG